MYPLLSVKERTAMWHDLFTRVRKIKRVGPLWKTCRGSPTIVNDTRLEDFFKITTYIFCLFYIFLKTFFKNWLRHESCFLHAIMMDELKEIWAVLKERFFAWKCTILDKKFIHFNLHVYGYQKDRSLLVFACFYIYINTVQHPTFCDLEEKLTCLR